MVHGRGRPRRAGWRIWGAAGIGFGSVVLGPPAASAKDDAAALQVLADVVLIESECRTVNVDYDKLYAFAQRSGIDPVAVMPLGQRRAAFDAATRQRSASMRVEQICSDLAAETAEAVPGVFRPR